MIFGEVTSLAVSKFKDSLIELKKILRDSGSPNRDHSICLFFMHCLRSNNIKFRTVANIFDKTMATAESNVGFHLADFQDERELGELFKFYLTRWKKLPPEGIKKINKTIDTWDRTNLNQNYSEIFEYTFKYLQRETDSALYQNIPSQELISLVASLAESTETTRIFDPFAHFADFGVGIENYEQYTGVELFDESAMIGKMRIAAQNKFQGQIVNSFLEFKLHSARLNHLIVGILPQPYLTGDLRKQTTENIVQLLTKSFDGDSKTSQIILAVPTSVLFSGGPFEEAREIIWNGDLINTVIALPPGMMGGTGTQYSILHLKKEKTNPNKVKFVDGTSFWSKSLRDFELYTDQLIDAIKSSNSEYCKIVDVKEHQPHRFNLSPSRYFVNLDKNKTQLKNILTNVEGNKPDEGTIGHFVRIRDLNDDPLEIILNETNLPIGEIDKANYFKIERSVLLIASQWLKIKPTYFLYSGEPIYVNRNIKMFVVDEKQVNREYLINELITEDTEKQINAYRLGAVIPRIRIDDFLEVSIPLPSLDEQQLKVQNLERIGTNYRQQIETVENKLAESNRLRQIDFGVLKHALGRPRLNLLSWTNILKKTINSNEELEQALDTALVDYDTTFGEAIQKMQKELEFVSRILEKGNTLLKIENVQLRPISLDELNKFVYSFIEVNSDFQIQIAPLESDSMEERAIRANILLLKLLINNTIDNACQHGFKGKNGESIIKINISEFNSELFITIKNNGKPFPQNYTKENFIQKYNTSDKTIGTGIGGYLVDNIARKFDNPNWELILNDPEFPVILKFTFQISESTHGE